MMKPEQKMYSTWRISRVHQGDIMSISGGVQYMGGIPKMRRE